MRVLVACEFSGAVREAFLALGHDAYSCDLLPAELVDGGRVTNRHYQCDVRDLLHKGWDLMVAHPPCTYLCNSGVSHLHKDPSRWERMREGALFFRALLDAPIPRIAMENPIMHRYAVEIIGRRQDQVIQPWMFGHGETKATCLWLKGLPKLLPTNVVEGRTPRLHRLPPGPNRWRERSRTFAGIAQAMAQQWGAVAGREAA